MEWSPRYIPKLKRQEKKGFQKKNVHYKGYMRQEETFGGDENVYLDYGWWWFQNCILMSKLIKLNNLNIFDLLPVNYTS